jgi:nitrogen fixation protein FixH
MSREITGRKALFGFIAAFSVIVAVNVTLAVKAISTFPGLETKNTYVASQRFDRERAAQVALGWTVTATASTSNLRLAFADSAGPVQPVIEQALLGRATHAAEDRTPAFEYDGQAFLAPVELAAGNWNLRLVARAADGTIFRQRIVLKVRE